MVESLFSKCAGILTETRSTLTPHMFQCLVFLKANRDWWSDKEVSKAIRQEKEGKEETKEQEDYKKNRQEIEVVEKE